ncbi:DUF58 domain-containing protein [Aliagarivorans marinus]|uniref:DUF58 domain-containing protein n=1 Tax=Aliagarivorans marinus TaxID=561965 RepID=UPI00040A14DE|nr:DUF58 domain-containing protein [Aliagarivorans marinus]
MDNYSVTHGANTQRSAVELSVQQLIDMRGYRLRLPPWKNTQALRHGNRLSRVRGRGMEFDEVRHYQPGDDVRSIDWRVTARTGRTHTKLFREDREHPVMIYLDMSASMWFGSTQVLKSVLAGELAAALGWLAQSLNERIGLVVQLGEQCVVERPAANRSAWLRMLHNICDHHQQQLARFKGQQLQHHADAQLAALDQLQKLVKTGYQLHLISDFYHLPQQSASRLLKLGQHNQCFAWQISDPLEQQLPRQLRSDLKVSRDGRAHWLSGSKVSFHSQYEAESQARQQHIERALLQSGMAFNALSTEHQWSDHV